MGKSELRILEFPNAQYLIPQFLIPKIANGTAGIAHCIWAHPLLTSGSLPSGLRYRSVLRTAPCGRPLQAACADLPHVCEASPDS
jgi:hypothetical protein